MAFAKPKLPADEHTVSVEHHSYPRILRRGSTLRSFMSSRRKKPQDDEEAGLKTGSSPLASPAKTFDTFRSDATTMKDEEK